MLPEPGHHATFQDSKLHQKASSKFLMHPHIWNNKLLVLVLSLKGFKLAAGCCHHSAPAMSGLAVSTYGLVPSCPATSSSCSWLHCCMQLATVYHSQTFEVLLMEAMVVGISMFHPSLRLNCGPRHPTSMHPLSLSSRYWLQVNPDRYLHQAVHMKSSVHSAFWTTPTV